MFFIRISGYLVIRLSATLLLLASFVSASFAQDVPRFYGEEVVVTAARLPVFVDKLSQVPANVTVITKKDIDETGATNLPEVLNRYEGLIVADSLGFGLEANIGMRGFGGESKSLLVLIDGVRISESFDNSLFWKLLPLQQIERVEIVRGGVSSIYGGGALAGVINIITKKGSEKRETNGRLSFGNYGEQKYYISTAGPIAGWKYFVNIGKEKFDGYRENSEHDETTILVKFNRNLDKNRSLGISLNNHESKSGIAQPLTKEAVEQNPRQKNEYASDSDGWNNKLSLYSLNYHHGPFIVNVFSESRIQDSIMTTKYGTSEMDLHTNSYGATTQFRTGGQGKSLTLGVEYRKDEVSNPSTYGKKELVTNAFGTFAQSEFGTKLINLILGLRYDRVNFDLFNRTPDQWTPWEEKKRIVSNLSSKFGLIFNPNEQTAIFANLSQSFKAPEANSMLFESAGLFTANPDIDPTVANNFETGLRFSGKDGAKGKISVYRIDSSREILFNAASSKNENFDTLRRGTEFSVKRQLTERILFSFGYTFSHAIFSSGTYEGKRIPLAPQNKYTAQMDYEILANLNFRIDWLGVNGQFALNDFNNLYPVEGYNVFNSRLSFEREKLNTYISVRNLLNAKYSAYVASNAAGEVRYNPAPERSVIAGVNISL